MAETMIDVKELAKMLGISTASIYRHQKNEVPGFPRPHRYSHRCTRYRLSEANAFLASVQDTKAPPVRGAEKPMFVTPPWETAANGEAT